MAGRAMDESTRPMSGRLCRRRARGPRKGSVVGSRSDPATRSTDRYDPRRAARRRLSQPKRQGRDARQPPRAPPGPGAVPARHPRLRRHRPAAARERDPGRAGRDPPRRARPGEEPHRPLPGRPARPVASVPGRHRAPRRPARAGLAGRAPDRGRGGRRGSHRLVGGGGPLQREAGDARHQHRRPHRRGGPRQGRRGPLPVRRAHDPLRAAAADASGHLQPERAARSGRADPGRPPQRDGGA